MKTHERVFQYLAPNRLFGSQTSAWMENTVQFWKHEPKSYRKKTKNFETLKKRSLIFIDRPFVYNSASVGSGTLWAMRIVSCNQLRWGSSFSFHQRLKWPTISHELPSVWERFSVGTGTLCALRAIIPAIIIPLESSIIMNWGPKVIGYKWPKSPRTEGGQIALRKRWITDVAK